MGRKKKKDNTIQPWQKFAIGALIVATAGYIKFAYFPGSETPKQEQEQVQEQPVEQVQPKAKTYAKVYFLAQNDNKQEVYRAVKREFDQDVPGSQLKFAVESLFRGPTIKENQKGMYSEIPSGTKLLGVEEDSDKIIVDVSSDFETGGGTEGVYKRLYQLIKTVNKNTSKPVYLYIEGKQAEVIGGEGIMITQPLSERSLEQ